MQARLIIALLALSLLSSGSGEARAQGQRKTESYFSPNGGVADAIVRELGLARREVEIAMYSITTDPATPIMQALKAATERGVKVTMIFNKARTGSSNKAKSLALENIGVDVRYVTKTMHEKFAIIDGAVLLTGSANWSTSADVNYSENTQVIRSPKYVVKAFRGEFGTLMDNSRDFDPREFE